MPSKTYRPKAGADSLALTFPLGGVTKHISEWPYETEDAEEQSFLDRHPLVTDRPEPKPKSDGKKGDS